MLIVQSEREGFISCLPRSEVVCEIGVLSGEFSEKILNIVKPQTLHLIDPWKTMDTGNLNYDLSNQLPRDIFETYFNLVKEKFKQEISIGKVAIHREESHKVSKTFPERYFDWVLVDGNHSFKGVYQDLVDYYPLVKDDGFILSHDYADGYMSKRLNWGTFQATNKFIKEYNCYPVLMNLEDEFPTIVIAKSNGPHVSSLISNLISKFKIMMDIDTDLFFENNYFIKVFIYDKPKFVYCLYKGENNE